ncbi:MAG TPA: type II toxin-antitoxin system RelE/ParE family toxin [Terriglobales bacterium]|nr:type II toxin-antitoxin system RelE/ParE family toxin [Terriglobales bacterium]
MTAKPVEFHQGAISDVKSAVAWYRKRSPRAALDFIEELRRAADTVREAPERWPRGKNNTRRFLLWRFPFSIIYSERESVITIWAVAHGSRRPEYWTRRL